MYYDPGGKVLRLSDVLGRLSLKERECGESAVQGMIRGHIRGDYDFDPRQGMVNPQRERAEVR